MKRIGHYIIRSLLGRGGMGRVFKVELPMVGKIAALKLLDPDPLVAKLLGMPKLRDLFLAEAKTMARLNHPHIVDLHDFDEDGGKPFYVMAYHANNLGSLIGEAYRIDQPSRTIRVDKAIDYLRQTLLGLACLHDAGIIHRDIKPFNLLITERDSIKICDFGLSKVRGESYCGPSQLNIGSPYYAAPEQERSPDAAGPSADLYPLGIMLYRMLTGRLPEHSPHHPDYQKPSGLNTDLDAAWDHFIARSMAVAPQDRFADPEEMRQSLDDLDRHWQEMKERACALPPVEAVHRRQQPAEPRSSPVKLAPKDAQDVFGLDALWRPRIYSCGSQISPSADIVFDHTTHLTWQRAGSRYLYTWSQSDEYIQRLNDEKFAGRDNWRLPTINELITLLRPTPQMQDLCIAPLFDSVQRWLWSSDRRSFVAAYYVDAQLGFVGWQDQCAPYYVRAVCSASSNRQSHDSRVSGR
jgi:serine/threonine-protein kinase